MAAPTKTWNPEANAGVSDKSKQSYGQILKSSALIGGSSVLNLGFGVIRNKAMALLLGTSGVGLYGLYGSIYDLTRTISGLGIGGSGVRQIAEAVGTSDSKKIARTVITLRRVAIVSGLGGALLLVLFCLPASQFTFGHYHQAAWIALLGLAVMCNNISMGQSALVQGVRRISDLARMSVLGAFYGTVLSIPIIYFFGQHGIVPFMICVSAMSIVTSWWYARKVRVEQMRLSGAEVIEEARGLLRMGLAFMISGFLGMGSAYLIRVLVLHLLGLEAAGCFQAAWVLGGYYVGFIMQAMGADFFPRLTAVANNHAECNRLVNEQAEVGLLLAGPGVIATLTFAPLVIQLFYSTQFQPAAEILRWICLGMVLRVASWPMGFILLAKGARRIFVWSELLTNVLFVLMVWAGLKCFGLPGAGIGFFGMYAAYWFGIYFVVRRMSGFRWSAANRRLALVFVPLVALIFIARIYLLPVVAMVLGGLATIGTGLWSVKILCQLVPFERFPAPVRKLIAWFRLAPPPAS